MSSAAGSTIVIERTGPLTGEVLVPGAKNSVLKLMAATVLADGVSTITNVPAIADVATMSELLAAIGVRTVPGTEPGSIRLDNQGDPCAEVPADLARRIRASVNLLGPLLTRCGRVRLALPGGDDFGSRPIDMHLAGLAAMGAEYEVGRGWVEVRAERLHGADITFEFPSVGATENVVMAAVHAHGTTVVDNAAREPEIADLCRMLVAMGADIEGIGTATLVVRGVERGSLVPTEHRTVPDRVQAATYLAAVGVAGGEIVLRDARAEHMEMLLKRFRAMGLQIAEVTGGLAAAMHGRLRATDVQTLPYPGVATDYKPLVVTMLTVADGESVVTENLYPGRFRYVDELVRLGADIRIVGHHAAVRGREHLVGAPVTAHDIRAGAALVVAGLAAEGTTVIGGVEHIDRGYDDLVGRLSSLGASIDRVPGVS